MDDLMGRIRSLKPEAMRNRRLAQVPPEVRWTFAALWCFCDDEGRAEDDPRLIKADIYPLDDITAEQLGEHLAQLAAAEVICRYAVDGQRYLHVPDFRGSGDFGQRPQKPQPARFPACDLTHSPNGQVALFDQYGSATVPVPPVVVGESSSRGRGRGRGSKPTPSALARFGEFYDPYPRHAGRADAEKAWGQVLTKGADPDMVIAGARRFAADPNLPPKQFIPHPATWLRAGRWDDDPLPPRFGDDDGPPPERGTW